jgi:phosphoglycolate phosphatase-like HAD superfamily hydrolase
MWITADDLQALFEQERREQESRRRMLDLYQPTVLVDFDGVIHKYSKGWQDGTAYDEPMDGAKEALEKLTNDGYKVVIFSTRDSGQIYEWLRKYQFPRYRVTNVKEPAVALIDDRAIRFTSWHDATDQLTYHYPIRKEG